MFRPVPMLRLTAVVLKRDQRAVLRGLGDLGAVQLLRVRPGPDTAPLDPLDRPAEIARCERLLARIADLRRTLEIPPAPAPAAASAPMALDKAEEILRAFETRTSDLTQRRQRLTQQQQAAVVTFNQVASYQGLAIPLDQVGQFSYLHFVTGSLPPENLAQLRQEAGAAVALLPLPPQEERQPIVALATRGGQAALDAALQRAGFQPAALPTVPGATTATLAAGSRREGEQAAVELEQLSGRLRTLAVEAAQPLAEVEQAADTERRLLEAERNFPRTESAVLITGWVASDGAAAVRQRLRDITGGRCAAELAPPQNVPEDEIPVLLRQPRLLRPFAMLVGGYGLPRYREVAPTLFVAISYVLMFGMMFGDAGHGAVLAIIGLVALFAGRSVLMRDAGLLLLLGGLSSVCFGVVYGSYFGIPQLKVHALWHDPLEGNPMGLMLTGIGVGVVVISLGLLLNIVNRFWRRDVIGGCLDKFGLLGVLFYWGMLVLVTNYAAVEARGLVRTALVLFLAVPVAGWALKGPIEYVRRGHAGHSAEHGGLGEAISESFVGAFEGVLSYFANTISFVRLAAYAMSHAALLMATFVVAAQVRHVPGAGASLSILVIIFGNLVALLLEGIVASVQALRLEYYEFFGKFFSGTGTAFQPFRLDAGAGKSG